MKNLINPPSLSALFPALFIALFFQSCSSSTSTKETSKAEDANATTSDEVTTEPLVNHDNEKKPSDFIPEGYVLFDKIYGDLNKDGIDDCVVMIKGTKKDKVIKDEYRGVLDRNRRGIIVLFKKDDYYVVASKNYDCFSSENEDGGVYYAPELDLGIDKGKLFVSYAHGRYGYWEYMFRQKDTDFELIGYDSSSNRGPTVLSLTSINFLTKRKQVKENINEDAESGDEVYKETWSDLKNQKIYKLSEIKDFDGLHEFK